jgi:hypothetical protein
MRTDQFRLFLSALLLALFGFEGCLEQKVKTTVSADGSCERTFVVGADSGHAPLTRLPLPADSSWTIRWEKQDTLRREGFIWTASKRYPTLAALSMDTVVPAQPGKIRISIEADRSFRWFYTYIHYRETYHRFAPIDRVPPTAVLTPEEIKRFSAGEENDTLKGKVEEWKHRNIADLFFCTLDTLNEAMASSGISAGMLRAHREDLLLKLSARKEINESLSEYLPSVTMKDLFQDSTFALTTHGLEAMRRLFVKSLGTESARALPVGEAWTKTMTTFFQTSMEEAGGDFENIVTLPGLFLDTNSGTLNGNTANWSFTRDQLELMDYAMYAESRVVNTWAFIVTGVIAVGFSLLLLLPHFRRGKNTSRKPVM